MGSVLASFTALVWFTALPWGMVFIVVFAAIALFVTGMLVGRKHPDKDDNLWHYGALGVSLFGKAICAFFPWFFGVMSGKTEISNWMLATPCGGCRSRYCHRGPSKIRGWVTYPFYRAHAKAETREEVAATN